MTAIASRQASAVPAGYAAPLSRRLGAGGALQDVLVRRDADRGAA